MNHNNTQNHILQNINPYKKIFKILMFYTIFLTGTYLFFVGGIVFNIIAKKETQSEIRTLTSNISELESKYLAMTNSVNIKEAIAKGFVAGGNVNYIKKPSLTLADNIVK